MAGIVLALAGLTCGDGGTGMDAATAPATVRFEGRWEGVLYDATGKVGDVALYDGMINLRNWGTLEYTWPYRVTLGPGNAVRVEEKKQGPSLGAFRLDQGELRLCVGMFPNERPRTFGQGPRAYLFILRPAVPRKQ